MDNLPSFKIGFRLYGMLMDLMNHGFFAIHGSAFHIEGKTILVIGPSGVGKSTLRQHLLDVFGGFVIHDDKPLLNIEQEMLCVTGHEHVSEDCKAFDKGFYKIDFIYVMQKGLETDIRDNQDKPLTLWQRFGIGMPDDTELLEAVLTYFHFIPIYTITLPHTKEALDEIIHHFANTTFKKALQ